MALPPGFIDYYHLDQGDKLTMVEDNGEIKILPPGKIEDKTETKG